MSEVRHQPAFRSTRPPSPARPREKNGVVLYVAAPARTREMAQPLHEHGFHFRPAHSLDEAMQEVSAQDFDVIVVDTHAGIDLERFYFVLEQLKPRLLERLIFLADDPEERDATDFIDRIDALKVWRSLDPDELCRMLNIVLGRLPH